MTIKELKEGFEELGIAMEQCLDAEDDVRLDYTGNTHVIVMEVTPLKAFTDRKGMTYDEFKSVYPNFVYWIESNGWVYDESKDTNSGIKS